MDLQVLLPGQSFSEERIETVPISEYHGVPKDWFTMQHLQLSASAAEGYLAILNPLSARNPERITATALGHFGVKVCGRTFTDLLWFHHGGMEDLQEGIAFCGKYGACLQRTNRTLWWLGAEGSIRHNGICLASFGPIVLADISDNRVTLDTEGMGVIRWNDQEIIIKESPAQTIIS